MTTNSDTHLTAAARGQVNTRAAEIYESFFVPALFAQFAGPALDHAVVASGERVLDVGCGTGVLAKTARERVGAGGTVAAVDPNEGMLAVARRSDPSIDWRTGVAEDLPFDGRSFDHSISHFAAMFFTDRAAAVAEMARVTDVGGTVTIATWSGLDRTPGYDAIISLVEDELGREAADALRAPFVLGEVADVELLCTRLGGDLRVEEVAGVARFSSIADWVHTDVRGWTLADIVDDEGEAALVERARHDLVRFVDADGRVEFPAPAIIGTAVIER